MFFDAWKFGRHVHVVRFAGVRVPDADVSNGPSSPSPASWATHRVPDGVSDGPSSPSSQSPTSWATPPVPSIDAHAWIPTLRTPDENDARQRFRQAIGALVDLYRDLEGPDSLDAVPPELAEQLEDLAVRLASVSFFRRAPRQFIAQATSLLSRGGGSDWLTEAPGHASEEPWMRALLRAMALPPAGHPLSSRTPQMARLLLNADGTLRDPAEAVRIICVNVRMWAPGAPIIFAHLSGERPRDELNADVRGCLLHAIGVVRDLQRNGIMQKGMPRHPWMVTERRAAADFAKALHLRMENRASRFDRPPRRAEAT